MLVHPVLVEIKQWLEAHLDFLEGLSGLGGRCLDGPGSSTTGVCDVERRDDLEGRGIVFVLMNLEGEKESLRVNAALGSGKRKYMFLRKARDKGTSQ